MKTGMFWGKNCSLPDLVTGGPGLPVVRVGGLGAGGGGGRGGGAPRTRGAQEGSLAFGPLNTRSLGLSVSLYGHSKNEGKDWWTGVQLVNSGKNLNIMGHSQTNIVLDATCDNKSL